MPDAEYRAAPAISQSALKTILDCPARYVWEKANPVTKAAYDFGHVVHGMVLGVGGTVARLDFPDRRTNAYKDAYAAAREAGEIPLLRDDYDRAKACADAVTNHPLAGPMITREGQSEVAMFWADPDTGTACKGLADRVTVTPDGTHWLIDLKTSGATVDPDAFGSSVAKYGYHVQAAYYTDGYEAATGERPRFVFVAVEKTHPHLVTVAELDDEAIESGRARYKDALDIYNRCVATGTWPGYTDQIAALITLPPWATKRRNTDLDY